VLIGDEMGVGKTIQAIGLAYIYKNEWPLLIFCPSSLVFPNISISYSMLCIRN